MSPSHLASHPPASTREYRPVNSHHGHSFPRTSSSPPTYAICVSSKIRDSPDAPVSCLASSSSPPTVSSLFPLRRVRTHSSAGSTTRQLISEQPDPIPPRLAVSALILCPSSPFHRRATSSSSATPASPPSGTSPLSSPEFEKRESALYSPALSTSSSSSGSSAFSSTSQTTADCSNSAPPRDCKGFPGLLPPPAVQIASSDDAEGELALARRKEWADKVVFHGLGLARRAS